MALPPEHGAWGLVLEPLVLGLAVAPSPAGFAFALAALAAFLFRHPAKVAWGDRSRGRVYPRTRAATVAAAVFAVAGLVASTAAWLLAGWEPFLPVLAAVPFAAVFLLAELRKKSRAWQAETSGATVFAAVPATLTEQLAEGGRLVAVVRDAKERFGKGTVFARIRGSVVARVAFDSAVPWLPGFEPQPGFVF